MNVSLEIASQLVYSMAGIDAECLSLKVSEVLQENRQ